MVGVGVPVEASVVAPVGVTVGIMCVACKKFSYNEVNDIFLLTFYHLESDTPTISIS